MFHKYVVLHTFFYEAKVKKLKWVHFSNFGGPFQLAMLLFISINCSPLESFKAPILGQVASNWLTLVQAC